jgi:thiamine-monophosphate kinase
MKDNIDNNGSNLGKEAGPESRNELDELGEFGLIERISENFQNRQLSTVVGIGDDAAVISGIEDYKIVSTDMLTEGIHFDLSYFPVKHLGYKAVAVNVSDIAAMNAIPSQITVSIAVSNRFSLQAIDEFYAGVQAACEHYNVDLVGGDTSSSAAGLFISITAIGNVTQGNLVKRSGAGDKDIICVTGDLGGAYIGLQVLEREKQVFLANPEMQPKLDDYEYVVGRQLKPEARMDIIHELRELNIIPTSMIDVSDGLASELLHLNKHSGLGLRIFEEQLPIDNQTYETAVAFNLDPITCVLNGGEDYELLFTISQDDYEKLKKHADIHFIGHMEKGDSGAGLVTKGGNWVQLEAQGWNHFKK